MYVHAEDFEHDVYGEHEYITHSECGEYNTGEHSGYFQHIQWCEYAEISEHDVTNTDDRHASRSWHHMRRRSRGA